MIGMFLGLPIGCLYLKMRFQAYHITVIRVFVGFYCRLLVFIEKSKAIYARFCAVIYSLAWDMLNLLFLVGYKYFFNQPSLKKIDVYAVIAFIMHAVFVFLILTQVCQIFASPQHSLFYNWKIYPLEVIIPLNLPEKLYLVVDIGY